MIKHPYLAGVTLIEAMVTVAVLAILAALAIPSFTPMLLNNRQSAQSTAFANALNFSRSTALQQKVNVQICPLGAAGSTTCGSNWGLGWIVTTVPSTGASALLQSYQAGPNDPKLSSTGASSIVFDPRGLATPQAHFTICDSRGSSFARSLQVFVTGAVQLGSTPGQAIWDGSSLTCP